jgi:parallel beta-helix repeat protein
MRLKRRLVTLSAIALLAQGVTVSVDAAIPVVDLDCGDVLDSSVKLADNLIDCSGFGLRVDAPNITIDLNGYRIEHDGSSNSADYGVDNFSGFFGVTVRNGRIRGFESGVTVGQGGTHNKVERMVIAGNDEYGIRFDEGHQTVIGNTVAGNGSLGLEFSGDDNLVKGNLVYSSGNDGVDLNVGDDNVVTNNFFVANDDIGIFIDGDRNRVVGNTVVKNGSDGIEGGGNDNLIKSNVVIGNGTDGDFEHGIEIDGDNNLFKANTVSANAAGGIRTPSGANSRIEKNITHANGYFGAPDGLGLGIDDGVATGTTGTGNIARGNDAGAECDPVALCVPNAGPGGTPFNCGDPVDSSIVLDNDLLSCTEDGLVVDADNITIDLNGHTIAHGGGTPDPGDDGIDIGSHSGVVVRNGIVKRFYDGIFAGASTGNQLNNVVVAGSFQNGVQLTGSNHVVKKSVMAGNGNYGVFIDLPINNQIVGNTTAFNVFQGINLGAGGGNLVKANRVAANGDSGITMTVADADRFLKNVILGNDNFGLFPTTSDDAVIKGNDVSGNVNTGIFIAAGSNNLISKNKANGNGYTPPGTSNDLGLGIDTSGTESAASSGNVARANDNPAECDPADIC